MPSGAGPGTEALFSIVGRKDDADEVAESFLLDVEALEPPRLEFTIAAVTVITPTEKAQRPVFFTDCILKDAFENI
jgi:hypothetical protein